MLIDSHSHVFPSEAALGAGTDDPAWRELYGGGAPRASAEQLVGALDAAGLDAAVICGFPWSDLRLCRMHNDYLLESASRYPGRLFPLACLPPRRSDGALEELQRCLEKGAAGAGEMAFYGEGFGEEQGRYVLETAGVLARHGRPLLLHANEEVGHAYPGKGPFSLLRLFEALREAPRVDIVLAHWGGGLFFYELMPEVKKACARVFYDTAASPYLYSPKVFRVALEILGKEKILLGTDYPLLSWERYVRHLDNAGVTAYERAAIMGGNAERLFRM